MSQFTDLFIKRPVLSCVVSLFVFFIGLRAIFMLSVQQFPTLENTVISITTSYVGASPEVIQGFITNPVQQAIASSDGIDYITSQSKQGASVIQAYIKLNFDPDKAFTNVMSKVSEVRNLLPSQAHDPVISKSTGSDLALMYISFSSKTMSPQQITDYIQRVVQPKLQTISGVAQANVLGGSVFSMRIWLDAGKMGALNISPNDINQALYNNNYQSAAGSTKGELISLPVNPHTDINTVEQFKNIVIRQTDNTLIRMSDVAKIELGSQSYDVNVTFNGQKAIFMSISPTPAANPLTVISEVKRVLPELQKQYPPSLDGKVVYDATEYIRSSLHEVIKTLFEATFIVLAVIFLFLGSARAVLIPVVTIPLSLVGVCAFMLALGYSINLLTLLSMVLAIGMVVDDAIVVVENIYRHIEEDMSPVDAALKGAREIAMPVISMTITLAAVYLPIGFMGGLTGALFTEFAFTLAGSVIISGLIALTLSPMMCSKLLNRNVYNNPLVHFVDRHFEKIKNNYHARLIGVLQYRPVVVVFAAIVICMIGYFYTHSMQELAPDEDQSVLFTSSTAPEYANIDYTSLFSKQFDDMFKSIPEIEDYFMVNGASSVNSAFGGTILKPWDQRKKTQMQLQPELQGKVTKVAGLNTVVFPEPPLPVSGNSLPIGFVLTTTHDFKTLYEYSNELTAAAMKSGYFMFLDNSLKFQKPQLELYINRDKAASLGITMSQIGNALSTSMSGNYLNFFNMGGRSYQVIPEVIRSDRYDSEHLKNIYITTSTGIAIPLATLISIKMSVQPNALTQFQQLNSATLTGMAMPGKTLGEALHFLQEKAKEILPNSISVDYSGQSRQYMTEGNSLLITFIFALITIYLVLAAQFESFRDPLVILVSVPMSICGALIPIYIGMASINIYTQVGLITLIGLISKHGILLVEFANKLQMDENLDRAQAILKAATIRLRPIVMTTAAMILGVIPLIHAKGAGAVSRFDIGIVIAMGMAIGTFFTLFVVPTMYTYLAKEHHKIV